MRTFSVAEQTVTDPISGASVQFAVDDNDTGTVYCILRAAASSRDSDNRADFNSSADPSRPASGNDYLRLTFMRNGMVNLVKMVDAEVETDERLRREAELRLGRGPGPALTVSEDERKAANEAAAKREEDDRALLASPPKVSKFATEDEKARAQAEYNRLYQTPANVAEAEERARKVAEMNRQPPYGQPPGVVNTAASVGSPNPRPGASQPPVFPSPGQPVYPSPEQPSPRFAPPAQPQSPAPGFAPPVQPRPLP